jgi:preprotein translocase subunit SecG
MYMFVLVIHIIVSLVLVAVILLQTGKGGGLAETFGGGGSSQTTIFGQKSGAFLTKATEVSAVLFLCTSLSLAYLSSKRQRSIMDGVQIMPVSQEAQLPFGAEAQPKTVSVKEVKIDPDTGKETIVKEETRPATAEEAQKLSTE